MKSNGGYQKFKPGKTRFSFDSVIKLIKKKFPTDHKLEKELTDEEAQELLNNLRKEKAGILNWLLNAKAKVERDIGHA